MENINEMNPLGYEKIGKLIKKFAIPAILAMLISSLYNVVDQIFIGQGVGRLGNAATNVVFPLTSISLAISLLIGIGSASNISIMLGEGKRDKASKIAGNAIWMMLLFGSLFAIIGELVLEPMLWAFGATKDVYPYAYAYAQITLIGMPFLIINNAMGNLIRADGSPRFAMMSMVAGAVINTILDPILIFGFNMGVEGAAIATITSQIISAIISLIYLFKFKKIDINKKSLGLDFKSWYHISALGMSNSLNQIALTVVQIVVNNSLAIYGAETIYGSDTPLAAFGVVMKLNALFIAFFVGVNQGTQPILGFNYGAGKYDRVMETFKKAIVIDIVAAAIGLIIFEVFPRSVIGMFSNGEDSALYIEFASKTLRIYLSMVIALGISFICNNLFSSIGQPVKGIFLSLSRQVMFLIPLTLLLPLAFGLDGIIIAGPVADFLACLLGLLFVMHQFSVLKRRMREQI